MKKCLKDQVIRARCDLGLKQEIGHLAFVNRLDEADIVRIACENFIQSLPRGAMLIHARQN